MIEEKKCKLVNGNLVELSPEETVWIMNRTEKGKKKKERRNKQEELNNLKEEIKQNNLESIPFLLNKSLNKNGKTFEKLQKFEEKALELEIKKEEKELEIERLEIAKEELDLEIKKLEKKFVAE